MFRSGQLMRPVFEAAKQAPRRIVYGEGEDERVLRAAQTLVDDGIARPILLGRRAVIERKIHEMGLRIDLTDGVRVLDPAQDDDVFGPLLPDYQRLVGRRGIPPDDAAYGLTRRGTVAAAMLLHAGLADAAICGGSANWWRQVRYVLPIIPRRPGVSRVYGLGCLILPHGTLFICDTQMVVDPTAEQIAEMTMLAAEAVSEFGITPKAALLSHSNFGASDSESRAQDAPRAGVAARAGAGARGRRRDARRCRPGGGDPRPRGARQPPDRHGEPAGDADAGCGQHRLHPAEGGGRTGCRSGRCCWACRSRSTCWCRA